MENKSTSVRDKVCMTLSSATARYDPANLATLANYVDEQLSGGPYSLENNLAVLTHYTLHPQCFDVNVCRKILIMALTQLPNRDFSDCLCLVPEHLQRDPKLQGIIRLEDAIQSCRFKQVWEELKDTCPAAPVAAGSTPATGGMGVSDLLNVHGFQDSLRGFICEVVGLTYQSIAAADLAALLHFSPSSSEFERTVRIHGWTLEETGPSAGGAGGAVVCINSAMFAGKDDAAGATALGAAGIMGGGGAGIITGGMMTSVPGSGLGGATKQQKAYHGQTMAHRTVDKHMSPENLKMCFSALSR